MIKVLSIGNSFTQNAAYYLHDIAKAGGADLKIVNLYIPGCSLETHMKNAISCEAAYEYELCGKSENRFISIKDALCEDEWDYIVTTQASYESGFEETYHPHIENLVRYIKKYVPCAEILICQSWAYEIDSDHPSYHLYNSSQEIMYNALRTAYQNVSDKLGLRLIKCGSAVQMIRKTKEFDYAGGGESLCADGYHMSLVYGRFAVASVWYQTICKKDIIQNKFKFTHGEIVDYKKIDVIKKCISDIK